MSIFVVILVLVSHPGRFELFLWTDFNGRHGLQLAEGVVDPFGLLLETCVVVAQELVGGFAASKSGSNGRVK